MAVIKNVHADRLAKQAVVLDLGDLGRQADRILGDARKQAERIIAAARADAQKLIDSAADRGYQQGHERGLREGREAGEHEGRARALEKFEPQLEKLINAWTAALNQWEADRGEMLLAAREDVVRFAVTVARKVVMRIVKADSTVIEDQLAEALALLSRPSTIVVSVHPNDRPIVEAVLPRVVSRLQQCEQASVRDDETLTPGGCVVATAGGRIDAAIETQLDRIARTLVPDQRPRGED
jgi:flagellar biosynthesis/type III secretory pathway protein FliH